MNTIDYRCGFKLTWKNARTLAKSSDQASKNGFYGLACSLNILSCEEYIKSLVVYLKTLHPNTTFINFNKIFTSHPIKHQELRDHLISANMNIGSLEFNILDNKEEFLDLLPKDKLKEYEKEYKDTERIKKRTEKIRKSEIIIDDVLEWLNKANAFKNQGLYVDFNSKGTSSAPSDFTPEKFKQEKQFRKLLKLHIRNSIDISTFTKELRDRNLI